MHALCPPRTQVEVGPSSATVLSFSVPKEMAEVVFLLGDDDEEEDGDDDDDGKRKKSKKSSSVKAETRAALVSDDLGVRTQLLR